MDALGRYRVVHEVARGGMGLVLRGQAPDGRPVALKLLLSLEERQRRRFASEVQALLRLRHPHVVALLDAGEQGGRPFLVMEWVEGETLEARLAREGPFDPRSAAELVRRLALALAHCHAQGVLHRDLKPSNVLLRAGSGEPLLTDFGLALDLGGSLSGSRATRTGQFLGTPGWWPPEQARGDLGAVGPRTDVYGLGALLHAALTARPPHDGQDLSALLLASEQPPPPPSARRPGIPPALDAVCLRCLAPDPAERFPSAAAVAQALGAAFGPAPAGRRRRLLHWVLGGAVALLPALGLLLLRRSPAPAAPAPAAPAPSGPAPAAPVAAAPLASAPSSEEVPWRDLLDQARGALQAGDPARAAGDLDRAIAAAPDHPEPWVMRGMIHELSGDTQAALADYARALEVVPDYVPALAGRGALRANAGDLPGGLQDLDRALELDPEDIDARATRGALRASLEHPGALADLDRVLVAQPANVGALGARADLAARRGDHRAAVADLDALLRIDPQNPLALASRGSSRRRLGDAAGARGDLDQALRLAPALIQAWTLRSALRLEQGDLAGALADADQAVARGPREARGHLARADARNARGERAEAIADLERALELEPEGTNAARARDFLARLRAAER